ncbi:hypothetical protein HN385_03250 [archaeon]|nr:hypothetical protein [archaeon]MBT3450405.1 hypothetical protein [archaeon]MBT6868497.1 hypothetical protein [archaeon]MBT7380063.1 hypothetical protein [archaeon]MBT7508280.1 hypothetical protein [archaeon]
MSNNLTFGGAFFACALACTMCSGGSNYMSERETDANFKDLDKKVTALSTNLETVCSEPQFLTKNLIGNDTPETYFLVNGQLAYLTIDGKSVNDYFGR